MWSEYMMGEIYAAGRGVAKDNDEAEKWHLCAARKGDKDSLEWIVNNPDTVKASTWFDLANHCDDMARIMYGPSSEKYKVHCSKKDVWMRKAAEGGHPEALWWLGKRYENGDRFLVPEKDWKTFEEWQALTHASWFRRCDIRRYKNARKDLYDIVEKYYAAAINCYKRSAEQGSEKGIAALNGMLRSGFVDKERELVLLSKAEQGDVRAQADLGEMYDVGNGVETNKAEAMNWYRRAAEGGDAAAQYELGVRFYNGKEVGQDKAESAKWCRKAAEQGFDNAQFMLANMLAAGEGVAQDFEEAFTWYRKVAEKGHSWSIFKVGLMCATGSGVAKDEEEAVFWLNMLRDELTGSEGPHLSSRIRSNAEWASFFATAEHGDISAQYIVGIMYDNGYDVAHVLEIEKITTLTGVDYGGRNVRSSPGVYDGNIEAQKWFRLAADQGHALSQIHLNKGDTH